ncbi:MAG: HEAT repeat domain-containing protein [Nitrospirae bacterium]|nr:HEAT repeat domain-containing protein [Nitrospirota bacterium]
MTNKLRIKKEYIYFALSIVLPIIFFWWLWNLNPAEEFLGQWMAFVDPKRSEHLDQALANKTDRQLLALLHHGDMNKAETAKVILANSGNPKLFDRVAKDLINKNEEIRARARSLLWSLDEKRAVQVYTNELETLDKESKDYRQVLGLLVNLKQPAVYPYLVEYAKREDGWRNASADYLAELGNPEALPILRNMLKKIPSENNITTRLSEKKISEAIAHLEEIAAQKSEGTKAYRNIY